MRTRDAGTLTTLYQFNYDANGSLSEVVDSRGFATKVQRSDAGATITSARGVKTVVALASSGFASGFSGPQRTGLAFTSDTLGLLTSERDARGLPHRFVYDSLGRLTADSDTSGTQTLVSDVTAISKRVTHTNAVSITSTRSLDVGPGKDVVKTTTQRGMITDSVAYQRNGTVASVTGGRIRTTSVNLADPRFGWPASFTSASEQEMGSIRSSFARALRVIGGSPNAPESGTALLDSTRINGRLFVDSLDLTNRRATSISAEGRRSQASFSTQGQLLSANVAGQIGTSLAYDSVGQLQRITNGGRVSQLNWDALGHLVDIVRPDRSQLTFKSDSLGRITEARMADTLLWSLTYDGLGNLTQAGMRDGRRYVLTYDARNLITVDSLVGPTVRLQLGSYQHDAIGRATASQLIGRPTISTQRDTAGRLSFVGGPSTWTRWSHLNGSELIASATSSSGQSYAVAYDGFLPNSITSSGLVTGAIHYAYTSDHWVRQIQLDGRAPTDFSFNRDGLVTRAGQLALERDPASGRTKKDSIGVVGLVRTYDDRGALRSLELRVAGITRFLEVVAYDSLGRVNAVRDSTSSEDASSSYVFDPLGQLSTASVNGSVVDAFTYDAAGNRETRTNGLGVTRATYGSNDALSTIDGRSITNDAAGAVAIDRLANDTVSYAYDDFGHLTGVRNTAQGDITFRLDGSGRRLQEFQNGQLKRAFLYGFAPTPSAELDAAGNIIAEYVYARNDGAPDYVMRGGKVIYLLKDYRGSVRRAVDVATGDIVQELDYDVLGGLTRVTNPLLHPFTFAGGMTDIGGRLVHFGARDYDARSGRWIEPDPLGPLGDANRYAYVSNDPINGRDPSGLCDDDDCERKFGPPLARPDVNLDYNVKLSQQHTYNPFWFKDQVGNRNPWDFKNQPTDGAHPELANYGNWHYGVVGKATSIPDIILLNEAGRNQEKTRAASGGLGRDVEGHGRPYDVGFDPFLGLRLVPGISPFGDDQKDQVWIKRGMDYYRCKYNK